MPKPKIDPKVKRAERRSAEKALREERLALAAITKVMMLECPEPARVLSRLDAMVRAANANSRVPATTRRALLDGTRFVRAAILRESEAPQMFDPPEAAPKPAEVDALVDSTDGPSQLGLEGQGSFLGDVETAHKERVETLRRVHEGVVEMIRKFGPLTDRALWERYTMNAHVEGWPPQSPGAIADRRKELCGAGRLVSAGRLTWDLVERAQVMA